MKRLFRFVWIVVKFIVTLADENSDRRRPER